MARIKGLTAVWDHVYDLFSHAEELSSVQAWKKDLRASVPDVVEREGWAFPCVAIGYAPDGVARGYRIVGSDDREKEVVFLYVTASTRAADTEAAAKGALDVVEAIVSVVKGNRNLLYEGNTAADLCRVDNIAVRTVRKALTDPNVNVWYGVAVAQLVIIGEYP